MPKHLGGGGGGIKDELPPLQNSASPLLCFFFHLYGKHLNKTQRSPANNGDKFIVKTPRVEVCQTGVQLAWVGVNTNLILNWMRCLPFQITRFGETLCILIWNASVVKLPFWCISLKQWMSKLKEDMKAVRHNRWEAGGGGDAFKLPFPPVIW